MSRKKQDRQEAPGSVFVDQVARVAFASMRTPSTAGGGANGERYTDWPAATATATSASSTRCRSSSRAPDSGHGALYREPLMLALNCSFQRRNSSTRASRTLGADVETFGGRPLRSGIAEGGRGVTNSSTRPSRTLNADVETVPERALRSGIAEGGRGVKPVSPCPCASRWAAYARSRESAEKAEPPVATAAMTASISKRFMMPSAVPGGVHVCSRS